ncbi:MAG: NADH dehydrogenase ubiquinone Fe-S protein 4, partial [Pseudomonadota bacterium]|nr:NADH dehydrogenase ubiquinone Fe-S protein 4 [Pseudomonadota bacterium]
MSARIYQPSKTAMSSGTAKTKNWVLEFVPEEPSVKDPFTGWNGASETRSQIRLKFSTLEEAQNYATANGLAARVEKPRKRKQAQKSYAD